MKPSAIRLYRDERGAGSLAEVLASIVVSVMAMAAIYEITVMQDRVYNVQNQVAEMEQIAEAAKTMIVRELDMAGYRPVPSVVFNGITLDNTQLRIRADLNGNGTTADLREALSEDLQPTLTRLEAMCAERRGLGMQSRMHWALHSWLLLHVPLSMALLVLALGAGADRDVLLTAGAMALGVALLAGLTAAGTTEGSRGKALRWAGRLLGAGLVACGVLLTIDGVLDV
jgi:hypothetical protein